MIFVNVFYKIFLYFYSGQVNAALTIYNSSSDVNFILGAVVTLQIISKIIIYSTFFYSVFLGINFILFDLKNTKNKVRGI